jgi:hypothetical protein
MTFIPIYNFLPRKSAEAPFIGLDDKETKKQGKEWVKGTGAKLNEMKENLPQLEALNASNKNIMASLEKMGEKLSQTAEEPIISPIADPIN